LPERLAQRGAEQRVIVDDDDPAHGSSYPSRKGRPMHLRAKAPVPLQNASALNPFFTMSVNSAN
jgi:hypothetical protein